MTQVSEPAERVSRDSSYNAPSHQQAVERVIRAMRDHLNEPLTLQDMADIAYLSRNHFHRVFHRIIGIPPGEFLTALCLDALARCPPLTKLCVVPLSFERVFLRTG